MDTRIDKSFTYAVKPDGTVDYVAGIDGKRQNLSGRNISSTEALESDLAQYTEAYVAGTLTSQPSIGEGVPVNTAATADAEVIIAEEIAQQVAAQEEAIVAQPEAETVAKQEETISPDQVEG